MERKDKKKPTRKSFTQGPQRKLTRMTNKVNNWEALLQFW